MHTRCDYRVPDEATSWPGKAFCLLWGIVFAPALLADLNDRLVNESRSGAAAGPAQLLSIIFWFAVVIACKEDVMATDPLWLLAALRLKPAAMRPGGRKQNGVFNTQSCFSLDLRESRLLECRTLPRGPAPQRHIPRTKHT